MELKKEEKDFSVTKKPPEASYPSQEPLRDTAGTITQDSSSLIREDGKTSEPEEN